ncbi:cyclophilin-like fold protein [Herbaspirillum chlorophenolicum]|uniref:cyclophilin-like fold protein n=1 Tax=Herbaspirillum chlorophenolicum TaxID=211589 RepID=UPI00067DD3E9|nr:cyclophilin-like fold protein [Herbaspirillum chlorophenolicum]
MDIEIDTGKQIVFAEIDDSAAARDFADLLPLTLALEDYASTEKIGFLPRKLNLDGAPPGTKPEVGSIAYYAPWGNLAIFYRDFKYSTGLVPLGRITSEISELQTNGELKVTIRLAK